MVYLGQSYRVDYTWKLELYAGACVCRAGAAWLEVRAVPFKLEKASVVGP